MSGKDKSKKLFTLSLCAVNAAAAVYLYINRASETAAAQTLLTNLFISCLAALIFLCASLVRSVRNDLFMYQNAVMAGGVCYLGALWARLLVYFLRCLSNRALLSPRGIFALLEHFTEMFAYKVTGIIGVICVLVAISNAVLIKHEGFRFKNLLSLALAVFYLGFTAGVWIITGLLPEKGGKIIHMLNVYVPMYLLIMLSYCECMFLGCVIMEAAALKLRPGYDTDFIIILGCAINEKGEPRPLLRGRNDAALAFAREQMAAAGKKCAFIPSGGKGSDEVISEGEAMRAYLIKQGADEKDIHPETRSVNTRENMLFSKRVGDRIKPGAVYAFATTDYHVFRSGIHARNAGINARGIAARTKWYFSPNGFIREFFGIMLMSLPAHISAALITLAICALAALASFRLG